MSIGFCCESSPQNLQVGFLEVLKVDRKDFQPAHCLAKWAMMSSTINTTTRGTPFIFVTLCLAMHILPLYFVSLRKLVMTIYAFLTLFQKNWKKLLIVYVDVCNFYL